MRHNPKKEVLPSHELLLSDYSERLARHLPGRRAVHIHLSNLRPFNRREHHVRIAANACETLSKRFEGQLFLLSNSDIVMVVKGASVNEIDQTVLRLRFLFSDDPLASGEEDGEHEFCTWYDLEQQYPQFRMMAKRMLEASERRKSRPATLPGGLGDAGEAMEPAKQPLDPMLLNRLEQSLASMDLRPFIRRQPICALMPSMPPKAVFNELYVSIAELRRRVIPEVDLTADRWLFQRLTQTLDFRIMSMLPDLEASLPLSTSLNINVATLLSPQFLTFDAKLRSMSKKTFVFELQSIDIFGDVGAYVFARDFVRERGYRVCLDGLNHLTFPLIQRNQLGLDLQKIIWAADMETDTREERHRRFAEAVQEAGPARVVLCRCDTPRAIEFGQSLGISLFQGRHIDALISGQRAS